VFLGAWIGQRWGITGVAVGVLAALFIGFLMMAQLSLRVVQISWSRFAQAQLPALCLGMVVGGVTLAAAVGTRHLALPPFAGLVAGLVAATGTAVLVVWLAPSVTLGEHGVRTRDTLREYVLDRLHPARLRGSA
jgi:PST family polysaccharide transporter